MKKIIFIVGFVLAMTSFASELYAQPPHAKAWGKRDKNWNKGEGRDEWTNSLKNKKHVKKAKKVHPAVVYRNHDNRPVRRGVVLNPGRKF